ncbi:electron transfer flavoprotein subunit beta/FixA family protein [Pseudomonas sp. H11T01]|jgi:electron transfer flavoprotein beta subunit|uniref:electron transfer flavoprotein subunit beta/FixA family protein n=1 Tax=Pseudomonas sp. H11T01 TaxID=3402749 RepID=UPI003AC95BB1
MHIVVTVKQVYDPNTPPALLQVGVDGKSVEVRSGSPVLNGYDANAVEEAIRLKEKFGAKVTVLSVGDDQAINQLRRALAIGADAAVLIQGPSALECDGALISELLAAAIGRLEPVDLILCGKASSDTDAGQTHLMLAERLNFPAVNSIKAVAIDGSGAALVDRLGEDSLQRLKVSLPALLGVSNEINKPRSPALKGVMMSKKATIPTWTAEELGVVNYLPSTTLLGLSVKPQAEVQTNLISTGSAESDGRALAELMVQEGLI